MKKAAIICVGRIKTGYWQAACGHYCKLISNWRQLECIEVRDGDAKLAPIARMDAESRSILSRLDTRDLPVALHEDGMSLNSSGFAEFLRHCDEKIMKRPVFIIGGPFGLAESVLASCQKRISLSPMTWPHELARVLLLEQLYRAESILRGTAYHH